MPHGQTIIQLFINADASTPIHELRHIAGRFNGDLAQTPGASEPLKRDWARMADFVGADPHTAWTVEQEEKLL